jgi:hypothetical protein
MPVPDVRTRDATLPCPQPMPLAPLAMLPMPFCGLTRDSARLDICSQKQKITGNELDAKAMVHEPPGVQRSRSCYFI